MAEMHLTEKAPLISDQFIKRVTLWIFGLAIVTVGLSVFGEWYSRRMVQGPHTSDTSLVDVFIGPDHLRLPANTFRFPEQRVTGEMESVSLYLLWPTLEGYSDQKSAQFNRISGNQNLIFVQLSQSTMTLDMSGRYQPIYSHLVDGPTTPGPAGLSVQHFKAGSGYGDEAMLRGPANETNPFVIRCLLPEKAADVTAADCQRDVAVGADLSVLYRYPSTLLPQWRAIDQAITRYIGEHIVAPQATRTGRVSQ